MKTYIKFLVSTFLKSFIYVVCTIFSLIVIINLLTELEFFREIDVNVFFTIYLALLNSPSMIFEVFPFIFLLTTQVFFIKLFTNNEIQIFKYSGLKNSRILLITSSISLILGLFIISVFYNTSSNLKNFYLELKSVYTKDGKYLAVINKNGLWIRDKIEDKVLIINSSKIEGNFLINNFITEFDRDFEVIRNIKSDIIDIKKNKWKIINPEIFIANASKKENFIEINSNFNYERIQSLFSNLSSLSFLGLLELKRNYKLLNFSTIDIDIHIQKLISYPIYLILMTVFSSVLMFGSKKIKSNTLKISIGLFLCVLIYYLNNLFYVLGLTERLHYMISVWAPLFVLIFPILIMTYRVNEK